MNKKIKYNSKIKKWIVSYNQSASKTKVIRKVEFFYPEDEELARKRYNEL